MINLRYLKVLAGTDRHVSERLHVNHNLASIPPIVKKSEKRLMLPGNEVDLDTYPYHEILRMGNFLVDNTRPFQAMLYF